MEKPSNSKQPPKNGEQEIMDFFRSLPVGASSFGSVGKPRRLDEFACGCNTDHPYTDIKPQSTWLSRRFASDYEVSAACAATASSEHYESVCARVAYGASSAKAYARGTAIPLDCAPTESQSRTSNDEDADSERRDIFNSKAVMTELFSMIDTGPAKLNQMEHMASPLKYDIETDLVQAKNKCPVKLHSQLSDKDRFHVGLGYRRWGVHYYEPGFPESVDFRYGQNCICNKSEFWRSLCYADKYGKTLTVLTMLCEKPSEDIAKKFVVNFKQFTNTLCSKECQLREFHMPYFDLTNTWPLDGTIHNLSLLLCIFLRQQKKIYAFDMKGAHFFFIQGFLVLASVINASFEHLRSLDLEDYFRVDHTIFDIGHFVYIMGKVRHLTRLQIDYHCLGEGVINELGKSCKHTLEFLTIKVSKDMPTGHIISSDTWGHLMQQCPRLKVKLMVDGVENMKKVHSTLALKMPLRELHITSSKIIPGTESMKDLKRIFDKLMDFYRDCIEKLFLDIDTLEPSLDEKLIHVFRTCFKLTSFYSYVQLKYSTTQQICWYRKEDKIRLKNCYIIIRGTTDDAFAMTAPSIIPLCEQFKKRKFKYEICKDLYKTEEVDSESD